MQFLNQYQYSILRMFNADYLKKYCNDINLIIENEIKIKVLIEKMTRDLKIIMAINPLPGKDCEALKYV